MVDRRLIPDMSTPEGVEKAFEHIRMHQETEKPELTRGMTLEILRLLQEAEVEDAVTLEEELKRTKQGSGEPLYEDVGVIGDVFGEEIDAASGPKDEADFRRIEGLAHAVSDMTSAMFLGANGDGDSGKEAIDERLEVLDDMGTGDEAQAAQTALRGIANNMLQVMPISE